MLPRLKATLVQEAQEILRLADRLNGDFETAAKWMLECDGRVIPAGIGKAGDIAKKFASTLSSTGTPSLFLHPAEAVHGDLGMVTSRDIVVLFTNSGETEEILRLFPPLRQIGARTILVTGRPHSTAARLSDLVLDVSVEREACPHNLAPTTSTTVMLALSDALALAVMQERNFTKDDYALYHPSGALGRRLLMKVTDAMRPWDDIATVGRETPVVDVLRAITSAGVGAACVVEPDRTLVGLISDGDIRRRLLESGADVLSMKAENLMTPNPRTVPATMTAVETLELFESLPQKIGEMPVIDDGKVVGLVMLKDLVRLGLR
ncbi:MAG: Arabinose 5-phosphate isomerase KdsD [Fimbriimonadales bacterium]|nr:MAG: KpsF/GutQ family sugar-phosphate isomerase [Armatimonadota bacterium]MBV6502502.1 Arabinose 5-phosphate isomerase KdsD [Fimbriimonadales bacterium]MCE7898655.1 KpsF/GutQ family sugar-phosphate isomerase [Armatimonadetes bacterium ATM1]MDL1928052.1 KpsF/GutQ family sugar-phosphate isomerase [Fimbriimonadia bacterium ATM]MBC6968506.1 KpsF/GutQ family sugar-phosphate isomerase [Armatimonadota bacterium]